MIGILYVLCFLVAILPFIMRLFFTSLSGGGEEVAVIAQTWLYPLDMGAIGMLVGAIHILFLKQGRHTVPWSEYKHVATDSFVAFMFGGGFLLMAIAPIDQTLGEYVRFLAPYFIGGAPAQFGVWIVLSILAIPAYIALELGLRRMERSYEYIEQS